MNILIVEDDRNTAELLKCLIEEHSNCLVVNICNSIDSSVNYIQKNQFKLDLIFMDIHLEDGECFEIFKQVEIVKPVIYCSVETSFFMKAFQNNGLAYIIKPFQPNDVEAALKKIQILSFVSSEPFKRADSFHFQHTLLARFREKMIPLPVEEIACISLEEGNCFAYKTNGEKLSLLENIDRIESVINSSVFFRVNRQTIVNRSAIKEIEPYFNRKMVVNLGANIEKPIVSRLKVAPFLDWLKGLSS